ncbi:MAG: OmpH family outer membrane protein [Candidatus Cloacimonetes bacterium]|nr:OmpH family outer membrane protein [Candidatus Cloacimonadota bacterium]
MKKLTIGLIMLTLMVLPIFAEVKIAYIDSERILAVSEDAKAAQKLFDVEKQGWEAKLKEIENEITQLQEDYDNRKLTLTEAGKGEYEENIEKKMQQRKSYLEGIFGENGLAMQKNSELLEPILEKLKRIIEEISNEKNLDIVFDASTSGIVYALPKLDITEDVITRMNTEN